MSEHDISKSRNLQELLERLSFKKLLAHALFYLTWLPLFKILDYVIPKQKSLWLFCQGRESFPFQSNQRILFEYAHQQKQYQTFVLLAPNLAVPEDIPADLCVFAGTWKGVWTLLRAGVVIIHHGTLDTHYGREISGRYRLILNLWHGIPIKGIVFHEYLSPPLLRRILMAQEVKKSHALISSSLADRTVMASCFRLPLAKIWVTGLPRNDWLVDSQKAQIPYFKRQVESLQALKADKKLILYAPTFRANGSGIYPFSKAEASLLSALLEEHNALLGIRAHINQHQASVLQNPGIVTLNARAFPETQAVLKQSDLLITDYSSIWIDYLILQRPMIGFFYDMEAYETHSRPLMYDVLTMFPGPQVRSFDALFEALERLLKTGLLPNEIQKQAWSLNYFHAYRDGQATERIYQRLISELEKC